MSDAPAVEFAGVTFAYPGSDPALRDVSLRVERGEVLGILGPNGGGKSTLLKLLLGLLTPDSGTIRVMGKSPQAARRDGIVGYVPQHSGVNREFPISVRQAIELSARIRRQKSNTTELVARTLDLVGMTDKAEAPIGQLSGGQFQRVQIARALAVEPSVLLLDEPTVGIDVAGQQRFAELVERVNREMGVTVLLVSHDVRAIASGARKCDRVACLSRSVHFHAAPDGLTPQVLADVFRHDIEGVFGGVHVEAHRAEDCPLDDPSDHDHDHTGGCC